MVQGRKRSTLRSERTRRITDALHQPRTANKARFARVPFKRAPTRRRPLDAEGRQYYEERYDNLGHSIAGIEAAIDHLRDQLASDVHDQGKRVDYRHAAKGRKAFSPTGKRFHGRPALAFDSAEREARGTIRDLRAEMRDVQRERAEITDIFRHGEVVGQHRRRLAAQRTRRR